jgi:hypothetical protein
MDLDEYVSISLNVVNENKWVFGRERPIDKILETIQPIVDVYVNILKEAIKNRNNMLIFLYSPRTSHILNSTFNNFYEIKKCVIMNLEYNDFIKDIIKEFCIDIKDKPEILTEYKRYLKIHQEEVRNYLFDYYHLEPTTTFDDICEEFNNMTTINIYLSDLIEYKNGFEISLENPILDHYENKDKLFSYIKELFSEVKSKDTQIPENILCIENDFGNLKINE